MAKQLNKSHNGGNQIYYSIGFNTDKTTLNEYGNYLFQVIVRKGNSTNKSPLNGFYVGESIGELV